MLISHVLGLYYFDLFAFIFDFCSLLKKKKQKRKSLDDSFEINLHVRIWNVLLL